MSSPLLLFKKGMRGKNRIKTKIGVGSIVKAKVRGIEDNSRKKRTRRTMNNVVGFVQSVVGNDIFLVQFVYGQKKYIRSSSILFLSSKEGVYMDEPLSNSIGKNKVNN